MRGDLARVDSGRRDLVPSASEPPLRGGCGTTQPDSAIPDSNTDSNPHACRSAVTLNCALPDGRADTQPNLSTNPVCLAGMD